MRIKSKRSVIVILLLVTALLVVAAAKIRHDRSEKLDNLPIADTAPWALHSVNVEQKDLYRTFTTLAKLIASQQIDIRSQVAGIVDSMGPREGVKVDKGQLLAKINVDELIENRAGLEAQVNAAKADVSRTLDEYQRQLALKKDGLTSDTLVEAHRTAWVNAKEKVNALQRQVSALNIRINYGDVKVPVSAVIAERSAEPGDAIQLGSLLYKLNVDSAARLKVTLPQEVLAQVHPSTQVILSYGQLTQTIPLNRIFPGLDEHALGIAEADLAMLPFGLPSGSRVSAKVILEQAKQSLVLPHRAIVTTAAGKNWCFKVVHKDQGNILKKVQIDILLTGEKFYAVQGNISINDRVIIAHRSVLLRLKDNDPVIVE